MKVDGQLTVGELQDFLDDKPDDEPVNVCACGAVGFAMSVSRTADGVLISE